MDDDDIPDNAWYCSQECEQEKSTKRKRKRKTVADNLVDHKMNYALLLVWKGLSQLVRKDAIRENNGRLILTHWKFDLLQFYASHHPKYFLMCSRLLIATNGGTSKRLQHTLTWNRTVNVNGGAGKNIAMDLQMEYFNKEYKESVKDAAGQLTENTIARHSQMIGVGKDLNKVYEIQVCGISGRHVHKSSDSNRNSDFKEFINLMLPEDIFNPTPGRHHNSFTDIEMNVYSKINRILLRARLVRIRKEESQKIKFRTMMLDRD